jgi:hypothetical protein
MSGLAGPCYHTSAPDPGVSYILAGILTFRDDESLGSASKYPEWGTLTVRGIPGGNSARMLTWSVVVKLERERHDFSSVCASKNEL